MTTHIVAMYYDGNPTPTPLGLDFNTLEKCQNQLNWQLVGIDPQEAPKMQIVTKQEAQAMEWSRGCFTQEAFNEFLINLRKA